MRLSLTFLPVDSMSMPQGRSAMMQATAVRQWLNENMTLYIVWSQ